MTFLGVAARTFKSGAWNRITLHGYTSTHYRNNTRLSVFRKYLAAGESRGTLRLFETLEWPGSLSQAKVPPQGKMWFKWLIVELERLGLEFYQN